MVRTAGLQAGSTLASGSTVRRKRGTPHHPLVCDVATTAAAALLDAGGNWVAFCEATLSAARSYEL